MVHSGDNKEAFSLIKSLTIYKYKRWCVLSTADYELFFWLWLETVHHQRRRCTISPCGSVICRCVGRDRAGGQAKGR